MRKREALLSLVVGVVVCLLLAVGCAAAPAAPPAAPAAPTQPTQAVPLAQPTSAAVSTPVAAPTAAPQATISAVPTAAPVPASTRPPVSRTPVSISSEPTIQVTGQVGEVAASARVITFVEAVHGFQDVALIDGTQIVGPDGSPRTLQDVQPGMVIQASGWANGSGGVIAQRVRIVS